MIDYAILKTEVQTDPQALGYAAPVAAGDDVATAALLNQVRAAIAVFRSRVESWELLACLVKAEWDALAAGDKQLYQVLVSLPFVNAADARIRALFGAIFGAATATRANLLAMAQRQGSRAEQLFGEGTGVSAADVARALRGAS